MWYEDLTFAGLCNIAGNMHVSKIIPIEHFEFSCQNTWILSSFVKYIVRNVITLYDSDCAIYIPPAETKRLNKTGYAWLC